MRDKNTIIGLVLMGVILFGFSWYQSTQFEKQRVARQEQLAIEDSLRLAALQDIAVDSFARMQASKPESAAVRENAPVLYKDTSISVAAHGTGQIVSLHNDKLDIAFTTRGAQPYSVNVKDYRKYGGDSLLLVTPGYSDYGIVVYAGESINTRDFDFTLAERTDSSVTMRLFFDNGGCIQQRYVLPQGSYMLHNELSFIGMEGLIPRNVTLFDIDWSLTVPRLEKGFKNEKQYSKLDVYCPGDKSPETVGKGGRDADKRFDNKVEWFDFNQQFFSAIMTAEDSFVSGDFSLKFAQENDSEHRLMTCTARMRNSLDFNGGKASYNYDFYFGPNSWHILRGYDRKYDKVITIGGSLIGLITRFVIIPCFDFLSRFISNYGIIILLMTILIKLVISPLTIKSYMSSAKMNALKPEIDKLSEKFPKAASDQKEAMKKQQATMDLYRRAGVNPMGGCLPLLLQFPILWAMFRFFPASIELRQQSFLWAEDLSAYDSILDFGFSILGMDHLSLFALLMALSMFFYTKLTMPQSNEPQMAPMRFISVWVMPIMMFFICNSLSAGLSYYYLVSNIITMIQTFVIKKWFVKPEKLLAKIEANRNKPLPKSKWQMRLEAAQKMAEQQQKARGRGAGGRR